MLRYKSRSTSLTIIASFCNSGSVFNYKIIKKEFVLGSKSSLSQGIYESFYGTLIRCRHCVDFIIVNNQIDHKVLR